MPIVSRVYCRIEEDYYTCNKLNHTPSVVYSILFQNN